MISDANKMFSWMTDYFDPCNERQVTWKGVYFENQTSEWVAYVSENDQQKKCLKIAVDRVFHMKAYVWSICETRICNW